MSRATHSRFALGLALACGLLTTTPTVADDRRSQVDLWQHISSNIRMPQTAHPEATAWAQRYGLYQADLYNSMERSKPYLWHIVRAVEDRGMPIEIALLPFIESNFDPFAYSSGQASGLWQIVPATAGRFELHSDWWFDQRRDLLMSTTAALDYLQYLHDLFDDWLLAVAAYNSGEGRVRTAVRRQMAKGRAFDFWSIRLPKETRAYVPKLLGLAAVLRNPQAYGVELPTLPDTPQTVSVRLPGQIDLAIASRMSGVDIDILYRLNPGLNRWATHPAGPHQLFVPKPAAPAFRNALENIGADQLLRWARHEIRSGETLGMIAEQYGVTIELIREVNRIQGQRIIAGRTLRIPTSQLAARAYSLSLVQRQEQQLSAPAKRSQRKRIHTVRRGDSLWEIARDYKVATGALARWNGMAPGDVLREGRKLVIWTENQVKLPAQSTSVVNYVVRRGDSLYEIARRFQVAVEDLRRWNGLKHKRHIVPGQKLKVFIARDGTRKT